ncbi:Rieske (2Fe-2S) protein [Nocardia sp. NEAU-G5]|uniref:Cytochrome bc1 complex Rieske iron-sulfur subunit n=1 Tax=Nocardia albiluteola TaxID=2842303 RepID=A0ABS6B7U9_9NOCA|nr:Rieske (2Fe-2S) protein [Nocardia albiluteola]MBU3066396.1 Rieske (2Fe-2S) protein [Nocardia albiluteola]
MCGQELNSADSGINRRTVMFAGVGAAAAATALTSVDQIGAPSATAAPAGQAECSAVAKVIAKTADIPVGGGVILGDVVVTQPMAGEFRAFCATCTHLGCHLGSVTNGTINCPCHGSQFHLDGKVAHGPAFLPLVQRPVHVDGTAVVLEPILPGADIPCPSLPNLFPSRPSTLTAPLSARG